MRYLLLIVFALPLFGASGTHESPPRPEPVRIKKWGNVVSVYAPKGPVTGPNVRLTPMQKDRIRMTQPSTSELTATSLVLTAPLIIESEGVETVIQAEDDKTLTVKSETNQDSGGSVTVSAGSGGEGGGGGKPHLDIHIHPPECGDRDTRPGCNRAFRPLESRIRAIGK